MEQNRMDHESEKEHDEEANEVVVLVAVGDVKGGDAGEDVDGVAVVVAAAACGDGKEIVVEKDEGVEREDREPAEETVGIVDVNQTVAAVVVVAAAEHRPLQLLLLHNHEVDDPLSREMIAL